MRRSALVFSLTVLTSILALAAPARAVVTHAVDDDGMAVAGDCDDPTATHSTIASGVGAAAAGDTVFVCPGTFADTGVSITVPLTLVGSGAGVTEIATTGNVLLPKADDITIADLTIRDASQAIRVEMAGGTVDGLTIDSVEMLANASRGIEIHNATTVTDLTLVDSAISGSGSGFRFASSAVGDGVVISGTSFSGGSLGFYQANDGSTGNVRDLHVSDSSFTGFTNTSFFAEEIRDSSVTDSVFFDTNRGITIFKNYTAAGVPVEDVEISGNTFVDMRNAAIILWQRHSALAGPITVAGNDFVQDVGELTANWAQIDVRMDTGFVHAPVEFSGNDFTLSGTFAGATETYGLKLRGMNGEAIVEDNDFDGGGVVPGGGAPPTSGVWMTTGDATFGPPGSMTDVHGTGNSITGYVNGVSIYDPVAASFGGLPAGTGFALTFGNLAGNSGLGAANGPGVSETADLTCNWWGAADGPGGPAGSGSGDGVTGNIAFTPWLTAPAPGGPCDGPQPMLRKQGVRDTLAALLPTGDDKDDKRIEKALKDLDESLEPDRWIDGSHLDPKKGHKVFDEEKDAVKDMEKVATVDLSALIDELVDIDRDLAEIAIDEAEAALVAAMGGDPKELDKGADDLAKAQEELAKGDAEAAMGDPDKAIDKHGKAWEKALKALEHAAKA